MALDTYANLQSAVAAELNRSDLATPIMDFITRFEAKARRELRDWLRSNILATNVTADYALPSTVAEVVSVNYNDGTSGSHNFPLDLVDRSRYQQLMDDQSILTSLPGQVVYVDVDQDAPSMTLHFWPPAGATAPIANLRIEIVKALPSLSASQTTNALLRDAPDLYLFGSCAEAARYLQHDDRISMWVSERDQGFKALRIIAERKAWGATPRPRVLNRVFG